MYTKLMTTGAAVAAIAGTANAVPFNMQRASNQVVQPAGTNVRVFQPVRHAKDATPDASLKDEDVMHYSHGPSVASFTPKVNGKDKKLVHTGRLGKYISSVECPNNAPMVLHFENNAAMRDVQQKWSWLDGSAKKSMILVVYDDVCGGVDGRKPFAVSKIDYSDNSAKFQAHPVRWEDIMDDYHIRIQSNARQIPGQTDVKQLPGQSKIGGDGSISVNKQFDQNIFSTNFNGVDLALQCSQCGLTGAFDYDLDLSLSDGVTGTFTAKDGLGIEFGVGLSASGELTDAYDADITFAKIPLDPFSLGSIADIGPEITFGGHAGISSVSAEVKATIGTKMTIPDGTVFTIGDDSDTDWEPSFEQIGPTISGSVSVGASVGPSITLDLTAEVFSKGVSAGIALNAPQFEVTLSADASSDGGACSDGDVAGVSISGDVNVELDIFGGFGDASEEPNSLTIYQKSFPVFSGCVGIGGGNSTSSKRSLHY